MSGLAVRHPVLAALAVVVRNLLIAALALSMGVALGYLISERGSTWPITLIGLTVYIGLIFYDPLAGFLLWIVTAPFSRFWYLDIVLGRGVPDITLTRTCAGFLILVILARVSAGKMSLPRFNRLDVLVLAVLVGIGVALPSSQDGLMTVITSYGDSYLTPAVIYFLARFLVRTRSDVQRVCSAFIILGVILATVAIHEQVTGDPLFVYSERSRWYTRDLNRLVGLLGNPAFFATIIVVSMCFGLYRFAHETRPSTRLLYLAVLAWCALGEFYTYNRAGYLSLALVIAGAAIAWPRFRRAVATATLAAGILLIVFWPTVMQSSVVTQRIQARGPVAYRMEVWTHAADLLKQDPLFGLGYNNFGRAFLRYLPDWAGWAVLPAPHNSLLEILFNTGVFGFIPYVAMFAMIVVGAFRFFARAPDPAARALIAPFGLAVLAYLTQAMVVDMGAAYYVNMVNMLVVGSLFGWQTASAAGDLQQPGSGQ